MKQTCVHCGQTFEIQTGTNEDAAVCPVCGKAASVSPLSQEAPNSAAQLPANPSSRSRIKGRDVLIAAAVLALLALLVFLFRQPKELGRNLVFGDLGGAATPTNNAAPQPAPPGIPVAGSGPATNAPMPPILTHPGNSVAGGIPAAVPPAPSVPGDSAPPPGPVAPDQVSTTPTPPPSVGGTGPSPVPTPGSSPTPAAPLVAPPAVAASGPPGVTGAGPSVGAAQSSPGSLDQGRTADLLAVANGSSTTPADLSPGNTAGLLGANSGSTSGQPGAGPGPGSGSGSGPGFDSSNGSGAGSSGSAPGMGANGLSATAALASGASDSGANAGTAVPPPADSASTPASPANPSTPPGQNPNTASLAGDANMLDSGTVRSNVVFILDHSRNMQGNGKTDAARKELLRDLNAMTPEHKFNVLCVNPAGYERMPRGSVEAGSGSIRGLKDWLFLIDHRFGSNPAQAVERALGMVPAPGSLWLTNWLLSLGPNSGSNQAQAVKSALNMGPAPDTLWLLSDGEFSPQVIAPIRQANDTVHAHINTDAIFSRDGGSVLREISQENYGIYRFIPPPDNKNNSPPDGTSPPPVSSDAKPPSPP